jgi:hypothetical protein
MALIMCLWLIPGILLYSLAEYGFFIIPALLLILAFAKSFKKLCKFQRQSNIIGWVMTIAYLGVIRMIVLSRGRRNMP